MKKTLSTIVLALGLVFTAVPAHAGDNGPDPVPTTPCGTGDAQPCTVPACNDYQAGGTGCDTSCQMAINDQIRVTWAREAVIAEQAERLDVQAAELAARGAKIDAQRKTIARLRAKLARSH